MSELLEPSVHRLLSYATESAVPAWVPWPMPKGWAVSGIGHGVDGASIVACSGPDLLDDLADIFVICEEPGGSLGSSALGATHAGSHRAPDRQAADGHITVDDHRAPMWRIDSDTDRDVFLGEAAGRWLWLVMFPDTTSLIMSDDFRLRGLADLVGELDLVPLTGLTIRRPW
ncbi:MAG: hypothetical protein L0K86_21490 [Actinomycetia bacterium]|nr:hypothetical protein [Actinomycetes bacterium]